MHGVVEPIGHWTEGFPTRRPSQAFWLFYRFSRCRERLSAVTLQGQSAFPSAPRPRTDVADPPWCFPGLSFTLVLMADLTHFDEDGSSRMVDVGSKPITARMARAMASVSMQGSTLELIRDRGLSKGDVLGVSRLAAIMAAKRTDELIPLCHSLPLTSVEVRFKFIGDSTLEIETQVETNAQTGVEMEALTAASVAALTVYDMCKAVDRGMTIEDVSLLEKSGGKSGHYLKPTRSKGSDK